MPSRRYETLASHVRFGSKADIAVGLRHVRFTPKSEQLLSTVVMSSLCHERTSALLIRSLNLTFDLRFRAIGSREQRLLFEPEAGAAVARLQSRRGARIQGSTGKWVSKVLLISITFSLVKPPPAASSEIALR